VVESKDLLDAFADGEAPALLSQPGSSVSAGSHSQPGSGPATALPPSSGGSLKLVPAASAGSTHGSAHGSAHDSGVSLGQPDSVGSAPEWRAGADAMALDGPEGAAWAAEAGGAAGGAAGSAAAREAAEEVEAALAKLRGRQDSVLAQRRSQLQALDSLIEAQRKTLEASVTERWAVDPDTAGCPRASAPPAHLRAPRAGLSARGGRAGRFTVGSKGANLKRAREVQGVWSVSVEAGEAVVVGASAAACAAARDILEFARLEISVAHRPTPRHAAAAR
jgi:hypothetical protein